MSNPLFFEPNQDQQDMLEVLKDFLRREVTPSAATRDRTHQFPFELVEQLGVMGIMGAQTPEIYGGSALPSTTFAWRMTNRASR